MQKEIWKDIKGYEGLYQVSNFGRIKSLGRSNIGGKGNYYRKTKMLTQQVYKNKRGNTSYKTVSLCKNGFSKRKTVHRIVAETFLENNENKEYVNHKDGNGLNNKVNNLEYISNSENQLYSLYVIKTTKNVKKVIAFDKKTNKKIKDFYSMSLASKWLLESGKTKDKTCLTGIIKCCKHKIPSYMGYIWKYESEVENNAKIN